MSRVPLAQFKNLSVVAAAARAAAVSRSAEGLGRAAASGLVNSSTSDSKVLDSDSLTFDASKARQVRLEKNIRTASKLISEIDPTSVASMYTLTYGPGVKPQPRDMTVFLRVFATFSGASSMRRFGIAGSRNFSLIEKQARAVLCITTSSSGSPSSFFTAQCKKHNLADGLKST